MSQAKLSEWLKKFKQIGKTPDLFYKLSVVMNIGDPELSYKLKIFQEKTLLPLLSNLSDTYSKTKSFEVD